MKLKDEQLVYKTLEAVAAAKTKEERIKILRDRNSLELRDILNGNFNDKIKWLLPEGAPPYNPWNKDKSTAPLLALSKSTKRLAYFVQGGPGTKMLVAKRERMFVDILESLDPNEALMLIDMKDKKLNYKGLTKKLVQEVFPNLM